MKKLKLKLPSARSAILGAFHINALWRIDGVPGIWTNRRAVKILDDGTPGTQPGKDCILATRYGKPRIFHREKNLEAFFGLKT